MASMVTTTDNPYDYFKQFDLWYAFDTQMGYNTCSYLARVCHTATDVCDADYEMLIDQACDEIVKFNLTGNYVKVTDNPPPGGSTETSPP